MPPTKPPTLDVGKLFDAHGAFVHRVAARLVGDARLADDVTQEVFLLVCERKPDLEDRLGVRTWLYRCTAHVVQHRRRSDRRYAAAMARLAEEPPPPVRAGDAAAERRRNGQLIQACLARMTPVQREVFELFELEEVEGADIAAMLEIPLNTVWSRLRLAREAFERAWVELHGRPS